jgi:hypothetical protein
MHDRDGKPLNIGDKVIVEFTIQETSATSEYCNVRCLTVEPMYPRETGDVMWFNAKQVVKK